MTSETENFEMLKDATDTRMRVWGEKLEDLFRNSLRGVAFYLRPDLGELGKTAKKIKEKIKIETVDINSLLIEFLSEAIAKSDYGNAVFTGAKFKKFGENFLEGEVSGTKVDGFEKDIKAVSYNEVDIKKNPETGMYETVLVFDV